MKYTTKALPPPKAARLQRIQSGLHVRFPVDFLEFMESDNGGIPLNRALETSNNVKVIDRFLPLLDDPKMYLEDDLYDMPAVWSQINDRLGEDPDEIGSQLIPIACLEFGDMVCLDFRKNPKAPEVCVWYHDQSEEYKPVTEKIANSFTEFLGKLKPLEP
jgi:SMI1-KNR4 cell-wall